MAVNSPVLGRTNNRTYAEVKISNSLKELGVSEQDCSLLAGDNSVCAKTETQPDKSVKFIISPEISFSISGEDIAKIQNKTRLFFSDEKYECNQHVDFKTAFKGNDDEFQVDGVCDGLSINGAAFVTSTSREVLDLFSSIIMNYMIHGEGCTQEYRAAYFLNKTMRESV